MKKLIRFYVGSDKSVKGSRAVMFEVSRLQMMALTLQMVACAEREGRTKAKRK